MASQGYTRPSRLLLIQADFQKKLLREKEEKLLKKYEDDQRKTEERIGRVIQHSGDRTRYGSGDGNQKEEQASVVREFFKERRNITKHGEGVPTIENHFKQKQINSGNYGEPQGKPPHPQSQKLSNTPKKNSAGRDKGNPLAPIDRSAINKHNSPKAKQKLGKQHRTNSFPNLRNDVLGQDRHYPYSDGNYSGHSDSGTTFNDDDSTGTPPNLTRVKQAQRNKARNQRQKRNEMQIESSDEEVKPKKSGKLTDFQKWQLEQDEARRKRLEKNHNSNQSSANYNDDDDDVDNGKGSVTEQERLLAEEIARKEKELMAQIQQRQHELEAIELSRKREEDEEVREEQRRQKEAEAREKRRQKQEAERRRKEEELRLQQQEVENDRYTHNNTQSSRYDSPVDFFPTKPVAVRHKPKPSVQKARVLPPSPPPIDSYEDKEQPKEDAAAFYAQAALQPDAEDVQLDLKPCPICQRKFNVDRLQKHMKACQSAQKKRKPLDPVKMRTEGTEAAKFVDAAPKRKQPRKKAVDWRHQHKEFVESIRYAKQCQEIEAKGGRVGDLPPPPRSENPDYKHCPYCDRKFNPDTAERHIPRCKDIKSRPAPPKKRR